MKRVVLILAILYLVMLIVVAAMMHTNLTSQWFVTSLLFSPRWVFALPLLLLVPWTLLVRWRLTLFYVVHVFVLLIPILGYQLPRRPPKPADATQVLHVLTCNVGGGELNQEQLVALVNDHQIDVLMLQECSQKIANSLFGELGWHHQQGHQVVIGSPLELSDLRVLARQPKSGFKVVAAIACELDWPDGGRVQLVSLHLPTFRPALEKLQRFDADEGPAAIEERGEMYRGVAKQVSDAAFHSGLPTIVAGDFNVPIESIFYRDFWSGYQNAFSLSGSGFGYTKYTRFHGVRIDHILADKSWTVLSSHVGPDLGGDHRPVIVELVRRLLP